MSGIRTAETQENSQNAEVVPEKGACPAPEQKNGTRTEEWHQNSRMATEQKNGTGTTETQQGSRSDSLREPCKNLHHARLSLLSRRTQVIAPKKAI